jgi:hypothetical protein
VQSPLRNPVSAANGALNGNRNIRLVEFNPNNNAAREFIYVMDNPNLGGGDNSRADKIGDAQSLGNGEFLVIERDDDKIPSDASASRFARLSSATRMVAMWSGQCWRKVVRLPARATPTIS